MGASVRQAHHDRPLSAADLELLRAVPAGACLPGSDQTPAPRSATCRKRGWPPAERARHAAWQADSQPSWPPGMSGNSLRQTTAASTLTSHHCETLLHSLTRGQRMAGEPGIALRAAADGIGRMRTRWLGIAHPLDQVTVTARGGAVSRRQAMRVAVGRGYQVLVHLFPARGRRSSSLMPPHTPYSCLVSSANARHCRRTGQSAQITFACVTWSREGPDPETGKNSSGSACQHAASSRQSRPGIVIISALSGLGEIVILGRKSLARVSGIS